MGRSYRDIPSSYASERQRAMEQRKRQEIIQTAMQESEVIRQLRYERAEERAKERLLFCLWMLMDRKLKEMESQRDRHAPVYPDEEWNKPFCDAVREIPMLKRVCNDLWFAYSVFGKTEFAEWL